MLVINTLPLDRYISVDLKKKIKDSQHKKTNDIVLLSLNSKNAKGLFMRKKIINTFSIGATITYLKIKQGKFIRRSLRGLKIFLNLFRDIIINRYLIGSNSFFLVLWGVITIQ